MIWARPDLLALLLLVPVALLVVLLVERARWRVLALIAAVELLPGILPPGLRKVRVWQALLTVTSILGMALAAAGPRLGFDWQQQKVEGVSIAVLLDVSRSMDAADVSPSRSERARREILDLVGMLRGDAVGLVVFAAGPYVRIPLTVDYDTFVWAVEDSSSATIRAQGSALAGGLDAATGLLSKADGSGKAILLVSDGESHDEPAELTQAIERAKAAGVRVYALGIGDTGGAPIPLEEGGFKKDAAGNIVLSRLDEAVLQQVASATGGAYVRAVPSDDDIRALYESEIRGKLGASERGIRREKLWHERFQWPLGVALACMAVSSALGIGRIRAARVAAAAAAFLLAGSLVFPSNALAGVAEDGQAALAAKKWDRAAELLGQARVEDPSDLQTTRGLAEALYRSGREREAEQLYRTLATQDPKNKPIYLYNAGNAAYRGGRLAQSLEDFKAAAEADPKLTAAASNATAVQKEIAARTEQKPPPESGESGDDQGGEGEDGQAQAGEQGDPKSGEGQPAAGAPKSPSDPSSGKPSDAGQQDGQADAQQGQPGEEPPPGEKPPSGAQPSGGAEPSDQSGERPPTADGATADGKAGDGAEGEQISAAGESSDATGDEAEGPSTGTGDMTAEEASRLVDSVPDGKPRVVVAGRGTEKDW